jgi:integrase
MKLATQSGKSPRDQKSVQETSKHPGSAQNAQISQNGEAASEQKSEGLGKTHVNYWKMRLFRNTYTREGERHEVNEWSVKIQHLGRRKTFSLGMTNRELAASKAKDIYLAIVGKGWEAAEAAFNPGMVVQKDDPSLGDFFAEVEAKASLKAKTFRNYVSAFRTIASGAFKTSDDKTKFDYRAGGHTKWAAGIAAIKLAAVTPDRVQAWKVAYLKAAGGSPVAVLSAKRTVNSYIRCARSLFSKPILKFVKLRMPQPLPFDGVELEDAGSMRYKSKMKPELLVIAARNELRDQHPESYKALLLGLFCGLRRSEIDLFEWSAIDWANHRIWVGVAEHFGPKTEDFVDVDPEVLDELRGMMKGSESPFVLNSHLPPRAGLDRQYYRCQRVFKHLTAWLRSKGINANKPVHELRKEFGSQVNQKHGIWAASVALRHSDITTSARHYVGKKQRITVGLGHLLAQPQASTVPGVKAGDGEIAVNAKNYVPCVPYVP